ncbi:hypothetical protein KQX54_010021 [Cotesia glomerata]|uniref:Uncharacterized protein n=1 Tax=Cotesia glomerata TaxID=32391 RepID=A0AAV7HUS9_COTGL|nr:hypothetical protein KQX54_010021 [Cotesia glomerata]
MNNFKELIDKGHIYRLGEEEKFYCTYALMDRVCQVTASITASGLIVVYGEHDHEPLFMQCQVRVDELLAQLKEDSVKSLFASLKVLKDQVIRRYSDVSHLLPDEVILFNINQARTEYRQQQIIWTFNDMEMLLSQHELDWEYNLVDTGGNRCALIITTESVVQRLGRSTELYIHYKTEHLPDQPRAEELITISTVQDNTLRPAIYVLLGIRGDYILYYGLWERLLQLQPDLAVYLRTVCGEISSSLAAGIITNFPRVEIKYSVVLYMRDIFKEWNLLSLHELPRKVLHYFSGIIFVPQEKRAGIFDDLLQQHQLYAQRLMILIERIREYWLTERRLMCFRAITYGANVVPFNSKSTNLFCFLSK